MKDNENMFLRRKKKRKNRIKNNKKKRQNVAIDVPFNLLEIVVHMKASS